MHSKNFAERFFPMPRMHRADFYYYASVAVGPRLG